MGKRAGAPRRTCGGQSGGGRKAHHAPGTARCCRRGHTRRSAPLHTQRSLGRRCSRRVFTGHAGSHRRQRSLRVDRHIRPLLHTPRTRFNDRVEAGVLRMRIEPRPDVRSLRRGALVRQMAGKRFPVGVRRLVGCGQKLVGTVGHTRGTRESGATLRAGGSAISTRRFTRIMCVVVYNIMRGGAASICGRTARRVLSTVTPPPPRSS